jgi:spore maturation protein CgeB
MDMEGNDDRRDFLQYMLLSLYHCQMIVLGHKAPNRVDKLKTFVRMAKRFYSLNLIREQGRAHNREG